MESVRLQTAQAKDLNKMFRQELENEKEKLSQCKDQQDINKD